MAIFIIKIPLIARGRKGLERQEYHRAWAVPQVPQPYVRRNAADAKS